MIREGVLQCEVLEFQDGQPSYLGPGLVDELPELLLLRVDGLAHPQRGVLPVLDVRARRADPGLAVAAVEPKRLT